MSLGSADVLNDVPIADAPDWFAEYLKPREVTSPSIDPAIEYDKAENIEWAADYIEKDAPRSVEGSGGELVTFKVAAELKDHGISYETACELMELRYNTPEHCDPIWSSTELRQKIKNAFDYTSISAPGERTAENEFGSDAADIEETDEQRIIREQRDRAKQEKVAHNSRPEGVKAESFVAYLPEHKYVYLPTGALWPPESVNASVGKGTTRKLDKDRAVQVMTWVPGMPSIIQDWLVNEDWIVAPGCATFNLYRPPSIKFGDANSAETWRAHLRLLYPTDADHIEKFFAHRVQKPGEKMNHALVLGGPTRIGKDTLIEPLRYAVGPWNFKEVTASQAMDKKNNGYVQAAVLRIAEVRDFGEKNRYAFYEHWKPWLTTPPNTITVADKYLRAHPVFNVVGVLITTNFKAGGIYLPPEDARHYVAWSDVTRDVLDASDPEYFRKLYRWYAEGGIAHVAAFLNELDLSGFDAAEPPPHTEAFWQMAQAHRQEIDQDLSDLLTSREVQAVTRDQLIEWAIEVGLTEVAESLRGSKAGAGLHRRLLECGFETVRNTTDKSGRWKVAGRQVHIYARTTLAQPERSKAAQRIVSEAKQAKAKSTEFEPWDFAS